MKKILIIDLYSMIGKFFSNLPVKKQVNQKQTHIVQGLYYMLQSRLQEDVQAVCAVLAGYDEMLVKNFPDTMIQEKVPEILQQQENSIIELLKLLKIDCIEARNKQTRDVMYTLLQELEEKEYQIRIVTADFEMLRFVKKQIEVEMPVMKNAGVKWEVYQLENVENEAGILPENIPFVMTLSEMNVTGKKLGIGYAMAKNIAAECRNTEELCEQISILPSERMQQKVLENRAYLEQRESEYICKKIDDVHFIEEKAMQFCKTEDIADKYAALLGVSEQENVLMEDTSVKPQQIKWSYHIEKVKNLTHAEQIWKSCLESEHCAFQIFYLKEQKETEMLSSTTGQMYLQFGSEDAKDTFAIALLNDFYKDTVFWMTNEQDISSDYMKDKMLQLLSERKNTTATFDCKSQYAGFVEHRDKINLESIEKITDNKIAAYLLNPLKSDYQIEEIAAEYLQLEMDNWQTLFGKADRKSAYTNSPDQLMDYYARMAYVSFKACELLEKKLNASGMMMLFRQIEMPLSYILYDMEQEGIKIDPQALKNYGDKLLVRMQELEQIIYEKTGEQFNINSPKQLGEVLFEKLKMPGGKKTKTGYSTAADVLEKLAEDYPLVKDILEYRQVAKLKSTYADGLAKYTDENNRIHTSFNQTITATGRLSSTEPNLQNIPMRMELGRWIRKVFIPREGCIFTDADYSQIELRVLAHMSEDEKLISAYQMSEDIHRITASQVFHTPFEEVTDLQRRNAKAVNFGIVYGISSFGLSQGLSISRKEASEYIERYFETYPGVKEFLDKLVSQAKLTGQSRSMFGRIRPIPELQSSNYMQRQFGERVAMNAPIQGTAADIIKIAMVRVWKALKEEQLSSKLILQIHDELLIETVLSEQEKVKEIMEREMQAAADLAVTLDIDLHTGTDWYEAK